MLQVNGALNHHEDDYFLPRPKEGHELRYFNEDGQCIGKMHIRELAHKLNDQSQQIQALQHLGFLVSGHTLKGLHFVENAHLVNGDTLSPVQEAFHIQFKDQPAHSLPLSLRVDFLPYFDMGVNFLGRIIFTKNQSQKEHVVPLTGTGTVALDSEQDEHRLWKYCTDDTTAMFQQRVALVFAVACAAGVGEDDLALLERRFLQLNEKFHHHADILHYIFRCCRISWGQRESYLVFMAHCYSHLPLEDKPPVLRSYLRHNGRPKKKYFQELMEFFSDQELEDAKQWWRERPALRHGLLLDEIQKAFKNTHLHDP